MSGYENIKDKGFDKRSTEEVREIARRGGKKSGETRRKKANFRKTLNTLLTAEIDSPEWSPLLHELGLDSTFESAINAAIIKKALSGNVNAYLAIRDTLGQTTKSKKDKEEQQANIEQTKAQTEKIKREQEREKEEEIKIIFEMASKNREEE